MYSRLKKQISEILYVHAQKDQNFRMNKIAPLYVEGGGE